MYLEREGYGRHAEKIDGHVLGAFLEGVPAHAKALERYSQDGNKLLLGALDGFLLSSDP
jgi:hypothetical protein